MCFKAKFQEHFTHASEHSDSSIVCVRNDEFDPLNFFNSALFRSLALSFDHDVDHGGVHLREFMVYKRDTQTRLIIDNM